MAKLLSYYRLCPLIDTKNLLGISEDVEKGVVLVTLGRNIVIKYRLSDQKQLCSWRSKEKFTSPVLYDNKLEKYAAVFNQLFIRVWIDNDEALDKVKKYKFNQPIHTIFRHNEEVFIVFKTGSLYPLSEALETRKTLSPAVIIETAIEIHDIIYTSLDEDLYFGILIKQDVGFKFYWTIYTYYSKNDFQENNLYLKNATLIGYTIFASNKKVDLLTAWSDGKIYAKNLVRYNKTQSDVGELFTVIESISRKHFIKIIPLDGKYFAIYGSDSNEEGAVLLIYNTQFRVVQSKQIHKLYSDEANIWRTYNFILLPVGQNLIVVPFCLESEQLVALIGSHKPEQNKIDSDIAFVTDFEVATWDKDNVAIVGKKKKKANKKNKQLSGKLKDRIDELFKEGLPEALIIEQIVPEILEESEISLLKECMKFFTDIPEKYLAKILKFVLSADKKILSNMYDNYQNLPLELLPVERVILLDQVLTKHFCDYLLLPYLRSELSVDNATLLLQYLVYQLSEDGHNIPQLNPVRTEEVLIKWSSLIIDANYQKFILSKDSTIEEVLKNCQRAVNEQLEVLESLKRIVPDLIQLEAEGEGKIYASGGLTNSLYSVEQIEY